MKKTTASAFSRKRMSAAVLFILRAFPAEIYGNEEEAYMKKSYGKLLAVMAAAVLAMTGRDGREQRERGTGGERPGGKHGRGGRNRGCRGRRADRGHHCEGF